MENIESILKGKEVLEGMPTEVQTVAYKNIMALYDDAENFIKIAEKHVNHAEPYVDHLKKLITNIEKNTEVMLDNFLKYVESGKPVTNTQKLKIENSAKEINMFIKQFLNKISH